MEVTDMGLAKTTVDGVLKRLATIAAHEVAKMRGVREDVWYF
jgi:hypothetical protein